MAAVAVSFTYPAFKHTLDWFNLIGRKQKSRVAGKITEETLFSPQCSTHTGRRCSFISFCARGRPVFVLPDEYLAGDKRWTDQLFLWQGPGGCCEKRWHLSFPDDICKFICRPLCEAASPVSKGCKRPCQFSEDNSTKTPFFSVVRGNNAFHWCPAKSCWQFDIVMLLIASIADIWLGDLQTVGCKASQTYEVTRSGNNFSVDFFGFCCQNVIGLLSGSA